MECLLQSECNFLHGFFRCKLLVEVVDVEGKITSMQGTHIFRRDRTTQLIKCAPWNTRLCPHPTIIKKMKTFLEVEGQFQHLVVNLGLHSQTPIPILEKTCHRKEEESHTQEEVQTSNPQACCSVPTLARGPPKPESDAPLPSVSAQESTPWPGTGKVSGNLFKDRNWLLPQNYLASENKNENATSITSPRPPIKEEEPKTNEQSLEKCG